MRPSEIKAGNTYEGPGPKRMRVYVQKVFARSPRGGARKVDYRPHGMPNGHFVRERLKSFAAWCVRLVPVEEE